MFDCSLNITFYTLKEEVFLKWQNIKDKDKNHQRGRLWDEAKLPHLHNLGLTTLDPWDQEQQQEVSRSIFHRLVCPNGVEEGGVVPGADLGQDEGQVAAVPI